MNQDTKDNRIIREVENESFRPLELLEKNEETASLLNCSDSMLRIKFDFEEGKNNQLLGEIKRNGGGKNLSLAIQVVLQNNQIAFLIGWSPQ